MKNAAADYSTELITAVKMFITRALAVVLYRKNNFTYSMKISVNK